ncbi:hypothetical protein GALL_16740 [mine drainage metagenome]|uniref:Uncharacterized protein n=1 Tax=mine drainage metagenome TaxID=410659 RepID=A0A1J5TBS7_9ZZZZ
MPVSLSSILMELLAIRLGQQAGEESNGSRCELYIKGS